MPSIRNLQNHNSYSSCQGSKNSNSIQIRGYSIKVGTTIHDAAAAINGKSDKTGVFASVVSQGKKQILQLHSNKAGTKIFDPRNILQNYSYKLVTSGVKADHATILTSVSSASNSASVVYHSNSGYRHKNQNNQASNDAIIGLGNKLKEKQTELEKAKKIASDATTKLKNEKVSFEKSNKKLDEQVKNLTSENKKLSLELDNINKNRFAIENDYQLDSKSKENTNPNQSTFVTRAKNALMEVKTKTMRMLRR